MRRDSNEKTILTQPTEYGMEFMKEGTNNESYKNKTSHTASYV